MKALAIREPWASLVASGRKTVDVRSWRTNYQGALVIVASSAFSHALCERWGVDPQPSTFAALVDLVDVRPLRQRDARAACMTRAAIRRWDYFAWVLENPRPLVRTPYRRARITTWELERGVRVRVAR